MDGTPPNSQHSPKRPRPKISTSTPHAPRRIVALEQGHNLQSSRETLLDDTSQADVVGIDELLDAVFGQVAGLADIHDKLVKDRLLCEGGWRAFYNEGAQSYLPRHSPLKEDGAFQPLTAVFEQCLVAADVSAIDSIVTLTVHGDDNMSTNFPNKTRPDATIHLTTTSLPWARVKSNIDHADVYLYVEVKKMDNQATLEDDTSKLLWNVHHRFRSDPRCRFVCGLTIENTTARFWHFSRAAVMVSKPFDIHKNADKLIHIFVSSARAPSLARLGFDPTITCIGRGGDDEAARQYEIQVHDNKDKPHEANMVVQTFITKRLISNYRAVGIRSRGTWIFEGTSEDGAPVVIKDVWIDHDREAEGSVLDHVREYLKRESPDDLEYFLDPLCHGAVIIDRAKDITQPLLHSSEMLPLGRPEKSLPVTISSGTKRKRSAGQSSMGSVPQLPGPDRVVIGRRGDPRKHYRIAFKGNTGRALHDVDNYQDAFTALLGGVKALRALHKSGYIHRDLSTGNVLFLQEPNKAGRGVLIDLEYAKRFPDPDQHGHDVRTGTVNFMAAEVINRSFLFTPSNPLDILSGLRMRRTSSQMPPWFHNPIHDLESTWWIALWIYYRLTSRVDHASLFYGTGDKKGMMLVVTRYFVDTCKGIPTEVLEVMDGWLEFIRSEYITLEKLLAEGQGAEFKYDHVFEKVLLFVAATRDALVAMPDSADIELVASGAPPCKRRESEEADNA